MTVPAAHLRAAIAQGEFFRNNTPDQWLPYVWEAYETLPARVDNHLRHDRPKAAEYDLLCAERFAGLIDYPTYSIRVLALGALEDGFLEVPR